MIGKRAALALFLFVMPTCGSGPTSVARQSYPPSPTLHARLGAKRIQTDTCLKGGTARDLYLALDESSGNPVAGADCGVPSQTFTSGGGTINYSVAAPDGLGTAISVAGGAGAYFTSSGDVAGYDLGANTNNINIRAWVRSCSPSGVKTIVSKKSSGATAVGWSLTINGTTPEFIVHDGTNGCTATATTNGADCTWHQIRAYWNGSAVDQCTISMDGGEGAGPVDQASMGTVDNTQSVMIGAQDDAGTGVNLFNGSIADVCVDVSASSIDSCASSESSSTNGEGFPDGIDGPKTPANASHTRATRATTFGQDLGLFGEVGTSDPTITSPLSASDQLQTDAGDGYYAGSQRVYLLLHNEAFDNAAWAKAGSLTVSADATAAPNGATTADRLVDADGGASGVASQAVVVAADTTVYLASVWVRCETPHVFQHYLRKQTGGSCTTATVTENPTCTTTWTRFDLDIQNASCTSIEYAIYPTDGPSASTGEMDVWRPTLINGAWESAYFPPTTTASVTIDADSLSYPNMQGGDTGTICAFIWPDEDGTITGAPAHYIASWNGTHDLTFFIKDTLANGGLGLQVIGVADTANGRSDTLVTRGAWNHVCAAWDRGASDIVFTIDGAEVTYNAAHDEAWDAPTLGTTLHVGDYTAACTPDCTANATIADFMYWNRKLSVSQMARVYRQHKGKYGL